MSETGILVLALAALAAVLAVALVALAYRSYFERIISENDVAGVPPRAGGESLYAPPAAGSPDEEREAPDPFNATYRYARAAHYLARKANAELERRPPPAARVRAEGGALLYDGPAGLTIGPPAEEDRDA